MIVSVDNKITSYRFQTTRLQSRLDQANAELQELMKKSSETEMMLNQQLEEARRDNALKEKDIATLKLVIVA